MIDVNMVCRNKSEVKCTFDKCDVHLTILCVWWRAVLAQEVNALTWAVGKAYLIALFHIHDNTTMHSIDTTNIRTMLWKSRGRLRGGSYALVALGRRYC
jgi:hypothetical protein